MEEEISGREVNFSNKNYLTPDKGHPNAHTSDLTANHHDLTADRMDNWSITC
jgi:hypothetical protein